MSDEMREAFEAAHPGAILHRMEDGTYFGLLQMNWRTWQLAWRASRRRTLKEILRGLHSENDSTQLRAIIAAIEALK